MPGTLQVLRNYQLPPAMISLCVTYMLSIFNIFLFPILLPTRMCFLHPLLFCHQ